MKKLKHYDKVRAWCTNNDIDIQETALKRRKQKRMEDFVVESACGVGEDVSTIDHFRTKLFYPCLDRMLAELEKRFWSIKAELVMGIQACSPLSPNLLSVEHLATLAKHYKIEIKQEEILVAKNYLAHKQENGENLDMKSVHQLLDPLMFPTVIKMVQVALTIPVSICSCERSFSALRRLHSWVRSTTGQNRLQHLAMLSIEKSALESVPEDAVIDRFAKMHNRKYSLTLPEKRER
ncbi:UNVERIFIED_CONTAM: hypothetical protein FKN15_033299 [Acipenser sinensis]